MRRQGIENRGRVMEGARVAGALAVSSVVFMANTVPEMVRQRLAARQSNRPRRRSA